MAKLRPVYFRHQVKPFVILFVERSGSTYLATLLDSHPEILALREELAVLRQQGLGGTEQLQWADDFLTPPLVGRTRARGFKSKLVDILDPEGFARLLHEKGCNIILLQRRNSVKAVISTLNARRLYQRSGSWNLLREADRMTPFMVDLEEFDALLEQRLRWDQELESYGNQLQLPKLRLYYEDLLQDKGSFLDAIFAFLGVPPRPVQGKTLKHTRDNLREVIINFADLRARYLGTPFESMFDEVLLPALTR